MGEYYNWVNVDRKEYICPADFDLGNKLLESSAPIMLFCAHSESFLLTSGVVRMLSLWVILKL